MAEIKAIETVYNGYRFRSRLEARWAVFFDAAGIKYEYEPEGYEYNGEKYLPDFYLPDFDAYVEVKPDRHGTEEDIMKCMRMIHWGGLIQTIIFLGNVPPESDGGHWHFPTLYYQSGFSDGGHVTSGWWFFQDTYDDDDNVSVIGHVSSSQYPIPFYVDNHGILHGRYVNEKIEGGYKHYNLKPSTEAVSDKTLGNKIYEKPEAYSDIDDKTWASFVMNGNEHFYKALAKARQARFEHGECGI